MLFLHFYNCFRLKFLFALILVSPLFACSSESGGASPANNATGLSWVAPSEREDGAGLSLSDIASYRIYYGSTAGIYENLINIKDPTATEIQLAGIPSGTYFAVMTTVDTDGRESVFSSEVIITV